MATLSYPVTRYSPPETVDLSARETRIRLSANSIQLFLNIMAAWSVRDEEARGLLGMTNGPFYAMKKAPEQKVLDADRLTRISYLVGIYKALHILHTPALANEWVQLPNTNRIFSGSTPLAFMLKGGTAAMQTVRRLLDARRGGV